MYKLDATFYLNIAGLAAIKNFCISQRSTCERYAQSCKITLISRDLGLSQLKIFGFVFLKTLRFAFIEPISQKIVSVIFI